MRSEGEEIGLRVFVGQRTASVSSSDLSARRARRSGRARRRDGARGAGGSACGARARPSGCGAAKRSIWKPTTAPIPIPSRSRRGRWRPRRRRATIPQVTNSEGAGISTGRTVIALATSAGFARGYTASGYSGWASVIAGEGGDMQRDHASHCVRHFADLDPPASDRRAGGGARGGAAQSGQARQRHDAGAVRSARRRRPDRPSARRDQRAGRSPASRASCSAARTSRSFRRRSRSSTIRTAGAASSRSRSTARGWRRAPRAGRSRPADRLAAQRRVGAPARAWSVTGHATRGVGGAPGVGATNVHLEPGAVTPAELMADVKLRRLRHRADRPGRQSGHRRL